MSRLLNMSEEDWLRSEVERLKKQLEANVEPDILVHIAEIERLRKITDQQRAQIDDLSEQVRKLKERM